jgi:proline racemase
MFGAVLLPPSRPDVKFGVVFMDGGGYLTMCGHGLIGVTVAAVETGLISEAEANQLINVETPAGVVAVRFERKSGLGIEVTLRNVTSYCADTDLIVQVDGKESRVDVAYGGNFYALVRAADAGLQLTPAFLPEIIQRGLAIRDAINHHKQFIHPDHPDIAGVALVEFYEDSQNAPPHARNVVVFGAGQADRSPCGTGTCARMALLYTQGKLKIGEEFVNQGIVGTRFRGRLIEERRVGSFSGAVPEITGSAFVTGIHQFVVDPSDPFGAGFTLAGC